MDDLETQFDPFITAYLQLKAFIEEGNHTESEVTEYAMKLNGELPQEDDVATILTKIRAVEMAARDGRGDADDEQRQPV